MADGRHLRTHDEAEVGLGLAEALGCGGRHARRPAASGGEVRFRVAGTVRALDAAGRSPMSARGGC